jgi:uncharacterized membrane protein YdjX (TVP38/TMEM64 family)
MRRRTVQAGVGLAAAGAAVALYVLVHPLHDAIGHAAAGDTTALRRQLRGAGLGGVLLLYALMLSHIVLLFPAEITNLVAGFTYGFPLALLICETGWLLSALGTYALGRVAGRPLVTRIAGAERLQAAEALMERGGWPVLLVLRLLPIVPYSPVGYVAGATGVPLRRFAWTTAVGSAPLIILVIALGSRLEHFSVTDPLVWLLTVPLLLLVLASHPVGRRLQRHAAAKDPH